MYRLTPGTMMLLLAMFGSVVLPQLGSVSMSVAYVITGAYANHVSRCESSVELPMPLTEPGLSASSTGMGDLTLLLV